MPTQKITSTQDRAAREIFRLALKSSVPDVVASAPAGAGKTHHLIDLALLARERGSAQVMIAAPTNAQCIEIALRLGRVGAPAYLFLRSGMRAPRAVRASSEVQEVEDVEGLPTGDAHVAIGTAHKWAYTKPPEDHTYDLLILDEAYQVPAYLFWQLRLRARRRILIGDPGQIAPVTHADVRQWREAACRPHEAAPKALRRAARGEKRPVPVVRFPATRRLPPDTARLVGRVFYPDHGSNKRGNGLTSLAPKRSLSFLPGDAPGNDAAGSAIEQVTVEEKSLALAVPSVKRQASEEKDVNLADTLARFICELAERLASGRVRLQVGKDAGHEGPLRPKNLGVACAHVAEVGAVRQRLPTNLQKEVLVETVNRWQGLEREVMIVWHPLATPRLRYQPFHLNSGRLCVALSRHRVACILVGSPDMDERLEGHAFRAERSFGDGISSDEQAGWRAHWRVLQHLT